MAENDTEKAEKRRLRCNAMIEKGIRNPKVKTLIQAMEKKGCTIPLDFLKCQDCSKKTESSDAALGGFLPDAQEVFFYNIYSFRY